MKRFKILPIILAIIMLMPMALFFAGCGEEPQPFRVTFDANGGVKIGGGAEKQDVLDYKQLVEPTYTKKGYNFIGWEPKLETITGETTVYAQWKTQGYTIRLDAVGGTCDIDRIFVDYNGEIKGLPTPEKEGFRFSHWAIRLSVNEELVLQEGMVWDRINGGIAKAVYVPKEDFLIKYKGLEGALELNGPNPYSYNKNGKNVILRSPVKIGYIFAGWTGTGLTSPTLEVVIPTGSTGDREYTANWTPKKYIVMLEGNGGTVDVEAIEVSYGATITDLPVATGGNGTFAGWMYEGKKIELGKTVWKDDFEDAIFYAMWKAEEYTVRFNIVYEDVGYRVGGTYDGQTIINIEKKIVYNGTLDDIDFPLPSRIEMEAEFFDEYEFYDWVYRMGIVDTTITHSTKFNELNFPMGGDVEITARYCKLWS